MEERRFKTYPYRWAVLAVFMGVNLTIQVLWISYAPITGQAARFYGVGDLQIGFFSMLFMLAFIPLSSRPRGPSTPGGSARPWA